MSRGLFNQFVNTFDKVVDSLADTIEGVFGIQPENEAVSPKMARKNDELSGQIIANLTQLESTNERITFLLKKAVDPSIILNLAVHTKILQLAQQYIDRYPFKSPERKNFQSQLNIIKFSIQQLNEKIVHQREIEAEYKNAFLLLTEEKQKIHNAAIAQLHKFVTKEMQLHFANRLSTDEGFDVADAAASTPRETPFGAFFQRELKARASIENDFKTERGLMEQDEYDNRITAEYQAVSSPSLGSS